MEVYKKRKTFIFFFPVFVVTIVFSPLFLGKNFLPFGSYPPYYFISKNGFCPDLKEDRLFNIIWQSKEFSLRENDFSGLSLHYPTYTFIAKNIKKGIIPLWDPYVGSGVPTFQNGQFKPFNPFFILFYLKTNSHIYSISIFLMLICGLIFMFLFLRSLKLSEYSSILGSLIFVLNPYIFHRISLTDTHSYFFLPLVMLIFGKLEKLGLFDLIKATAVLVFLGHIGHNEVDFLIAFLGWLYFFVFNRNSFLKKLSFSLVCAVLTFLALSFYIIPFLDYFLKGENYKVILSKLKVLTTLKEFFVISSDVNLLPSIIFLLILGFLGWDKKRLFFVVVLIISILYFSKIPFLGSFVEKFKITLITPVYLKLFFWFSISVLVAYGFENFLRSEKRVLEIIIFVVSFLFLIYFSSKLIFPLNRYFKNLNLFYFLAFLPIFSTILKPFLRKIFIKENIKGDVIILIMIFFMVSPYLYPLSVNFLMWNDCDIKTYDCIDYLKENYPHSRVSSVATYFKNPFPPNYGSIFSIRQIELNTFIFPNSLLRMVKDYAPAPTLLIFEKFDSEFLKKMGVDFVLVPKNEFFLDRSKLIFEGSFVDIFSLGNSFNRAFFANNLFSVSSFKGIEAEKIKSLKEKDVLVLNDRNFDYDYDGSGELKFVKDDLHEIIMEVRIKSEAFLVLRDTFDKDWKAFIDGVETKSYLVDGNFRGIFVPEGEHKIVWRYVPKTFYVNCVVSIIFHLITIFGLSFFLLKRVKWRKF